MKPEIAVLMSPAVEAETKRKLAEMAEKDNVAAAAVMEPLPGATREAFKIQQEIEVGPYKVRPLVDGDFDLFVHFDTPPANYLCKGLAGEAGGALSGLSRGLPLWQIAFIMTRPAKVSLQLIRAEGVKGFNEAVEAEFFESTYPQMVEVFRAACQQLQAYWAPALKYGPASDGKSDGGADAANPTSTATQ